MVFWLDDSFAGNLVHCRTRQRCREPSSSITGDTKSGVPVESERDSPDRLSSRFTAMKRVDALTRKAIRLEKAKVAVPGVMDLVGSFPRRP